MNKNTSIDKPIDGQTATASQSANPTTRQPARWLMMVCCIAMVVGVAGIFVLGPQEKAWASKMMLALPLLACVGAHFLLHRLTGGHSCEQSNSKEDK